MDKNTTIGLVLIAVLLFGYSYYTTSNMPQQPVQTTPAVTEADVTQQSKESEKQQKKAVVQQMVDSTALFFNCKTAGKDNLVAIENEKLRVELNAKGGMVANVYLK